MTSKRVLQRSGLSVAVLLAAAAFLVALPLLSFAAVALRVVLLVVLAALVVAGGIAYSLSAAFRERVRAMFGTNLLHRGLRLSGDVDLDQAHTWTRFNTEEAIVGADDLVPAVLGPADRIDLPVAGRRVQRGEPLFRVHSGTRSVAVAAPIDGVVTSRNEALADKASVLSEDPYHGGWVVRVRPDDPHAARDRLLHGRHARAFFREEVDRLIDVLMMAGPVPTLPDGGAVVAELHRHVDDGTWREIRQRFFEDWS